MRKEVATRAALLVIFSGIAACGQKGKLYLPEASSEVVTRPAETPPASESTGAPSTPQTPDAQPAAPPAAPEVSVEETKKDKGVTPPPPK